MTSHPESNPKPLGDLQPNVIDFRGRGGIARSSATVSPSPQSPVGDRIWRRWEIYGCFFLYVIAIQLAFGPKIRLSQWGMAASSNAAVAEGIAWTRGRFDIPVLIKADLKWEGGPPGVDPRDPEMRLHDSAYNPADGKCYNVFPPIFAMLTAALAPLHDLMGMPEGVWRPEFMALFVYWPIVISAFVVFYLRLGNPAWGAMWAFAFIGGSALLPNLGEAGQGFLGQLDHAISQVGLLIIASDILGRQRLWPSLIGLAIACYARQMTSLFGLALLWVAFDRYRWKGLVLCGLGLAAVASPLVILNTYKFGHPLDFGYHHIYVGREDDYMGSRCVKYGVFSPKFILGLEGEHGNLYYMHVAPPAIGTVSLIEFNVHDSNQNGTSLWITTPLALWVLIAAARWWRERAARALMLGTVPVMIGLAMYHSPGFMEHGYNRFALDFLPIWLVVVAPYALGGAQRWRSWLTLMLAAWGLLYFHIITPEARMNVASSAPTNVERRTHGEV